VEPNEKKDFPMRLATKKLIGISVVIAVVTLSGCTDSLSEANALLIEENGSLRNQIDSQDRALADAQHDLRDSAGRIAQFRRQIDDYERGMSNTGRITGFEGIAGVNATISGNEITVSVESDVLFSSGKTSLKGAAKNSLSQVASVLNNNYSSRSVRIEGYTDTDPIRKSGHKSNYHLAFERAYAVRDYLIQRGITKDRISLASYGPDKPLGSKSQSRRVEIVVIAN